MDTINEKLFGCLCRTCMQELTEASLDDASIKPEQQWQSIFDTVEECGSLRIAELLSNTIPQIEVKLSDVLPKKICRKCLEQVQSIYRFQQMCVQSDKHMRELVTNGNADLKITITDASVELNKSTTEFAEQECFLEDREQNIVFESVGILPEPAQSSAVDPLQSIEETILPCQNSQADVGVYVLNETCNGHGDDYEPNVENINGETLLSTVSIKTEALSVETEEKQEGYTSSTHTCSLCNKSFKQLRLLNRHLERHKKWDEQHLRLPSSAHICSLCKKPFNQLRLLKRHLERHKKWDGQKRLPKEGEQNEIVTSKSAVKTVETEEQKLSLPSSTNICHLCNKPFKQRRHLRRHLERHKKWEQKSLTKGEYKNDENSEGKVMPSTVNTKDTEMALETQEQKLSLPSATHICSLCNKSFKQLRLLKRHLKRHKGGDEQEGISVQNNEKSDQCRFKCDICNRYFHREKSLHKHRLGHDAKEELRSYTCELCDKKLGSQHSLRRHLHTHTGEKPFLCPECGKSFVTESLLKQHILRHADTETFECPHCPKKFRCKNYLSKHILIHQEIKKYACDICGDRFVKGHQLTIHKRYHNGVKPHKCDYCDMRFVTRHGMRRHMRTHTGEKPYKCEYCERAFAQSNEHVNHLRTHIGDNVYRCELCPSAFRLASELRIHFATHKNDDEETRERNMKALKEEEAKLQLKMSLK